MYIYARINKDTLRFIREKKGYLIMDSRWSFMERQEFMKIVDEAQNTMK